MRPLRAAFLCVAMLLAASAPASSINIGLGTRVAVASPPVGTLWSTLGVIADGTTDNAAAINALPTGTTIIGDCPAGGRIVMRSQWFLQSNLTIYVQSGCIISARWAGNQGAGFITQTDVNTATTTVFINGLSVQNDAPTFQGKALRFWVDHLTLTNFTSSGFRAFAYVRGSDQEWSVNVSSPASTVSSGIATDGFRPFGNTPKVATTPGRPANVWVHDSFIQSGDGALQVGGGCQPGSVWYNLDSDGYLYENNTFSGTPGNGFIVGDGAQDVGLSCTNRITNVVVRNTAGSSGTSCIRVQNAFNPTGAVDGVTFLNITCDMSPQNTQSGQAAIMVRGYDSSPINNLTLSGVTVLNTYGRCADISAFPTTGIVLDNVTCPAARAAALSNLVVRSTSGIVIRNSSIANLVGGAIEIGPPPDTGTDLLSRVNGGVFTVVSPSISNNTLANVTNNRWGVRLRNVDAASVTGNTMLNAAGATKSIGISYEAAGATTPGTTGSVATGNNVSAMGNNPTIVFTCNGGTTNAASSNTGSPDYTCP